MGMDKSWGSRRLALLDSLPEKIIESVRAGHISTWSANRILAPLARANSEHAGKLAEHLKNTKMSTRDLSRFFDHYKKANNKIRENMVNQPHLFMKARKAKKFNKEAKALDGGVEGLFVKDIKVAGHILRRLIKKASDVFYPGQSNLDRRSILTAFNETHKVMVHLEKTVRRLSDGVQ